MAVCPGAEESSRGRTGTEGVSKKEVDIRENGPTSPRHVTEVSISRVEIESEVWFSTR